MKCKIMFYPQGEESKISCHFNISPCQQLVLNPKSVLKKDPCEKEQISGTEKADLDILCMFTCSNELLQCCLRHWYWLQRNTFRSDLY